MKKNIWSVFGVAIIALSFTAACSKKLMPPEIEAQGTVEEQPTAQEVAEVEAEVEPWAPVEDVAPVEEPVEMNTQQFLNEEDVDTFAPGTEEKTADLGEIPGNGSNGAFGLDTYGNPLAENPEVRSPEQSATAPAATSKVDEAMEEARLFKFQPTSELKDVHFRFDKYDLDNSSKDVLRHNANYLKSNPLVKVEIQGHCDERGTNNYNLALGHRRAVSTKNFLMAQGIDEGRLRIISYGEEKPFCDESNESCWWRNRRAHFMVAE